MQSDGPEKTEASEVLALSERQLEAYNRGDLDAFCACYHDEVEVFGEDGVAKLRGIEAFRARYGAMFAAHRDVRADVSERMLLGSHHVIERERWSRVERASGQTRSGEILVRYTAREGKIRWAQFLDDGAPTSEPAAAVARKGRVVVVAGTGTDVGKTHVTAALLAYARSTGKTARGYKPVATGVDARCDDAEAHSAASGHALEAPTYAYRRPVSPHLAAREEGRPIALEPVVRRARALLDEGCERLVVELAGGLCSPLGPALDNVSMISALGPERTVLVAPDRLGVLHEVRCALLAARARGIALPTVVLSAPERADASTGLNARELDALGIAAVAASFPRAARDAEATRDAAAALWRALA